MNLRIPLTLCALWLMVGFADAQSEDPELLRLKFDEQIATALMSREARINQLMGKYSTMLERLNNAYRKASNLDGVLAVMNEQERLQGDRTIRADHINDTFKELGALQKKVLGYYAGMRKAEASEIVAATTAFSKQMQGLQVNLTKAGKIKEAIAAKEILEEVLAGPDYTSARAYLAPSPEPHIDTPASSARSDRAAQASDSDARSSRRSSEFSGSAPSYGKIKLYPKGNEPKRTAKKEQNYQTGTASIAAGSKIIATLQKITEESTKSKSRDYYSSSRDISKAYIPRLVFAAGPSHNYRDATLMFEYFTRRGNTRSLVKTDRINIPVLESMKYMVADAEGYANIITKTQGSYYESSSRSSEKPEYYGFITSIYDSKGNLLYQRCTNKSLAQYGKAKLESLR